MLDCFVSLFLYLLTHFPFGRNFSMSRRPISPYTFFLQSSSSLRSSSSAAVAALPLPLREAVVANLALRSSCSRRLSLTSRKLTPLATSNLRLATSKITTLPICKLLPTNSDSPPTSNNNNNNNRLLATTKQRFGFGAPRITRLHTPSPLRETIHHAFLSLGTHNKSEQDGEVRSISIDQL